MAPLKRLYRWLEVLPQTKLAKYLTIIIAIVCCQQLAKLSWSLISPNSSTNNNKTQPISVNHSNFSLLTKNDSYMLTDIKNLALFGQEPKTSAPLTGSDNEIGTSMYDSLPIAHINANLMGIVSSDRQDLALAIFNVGNKQVSYGVGETVAGAKIEHIFQNRVIVSLQGHNEVIPFDDIEEINTQKHISNSQGNRAIKEAIQESDEDDVFSEDDMDNLFDYVSISPVLIDKKLTGYRLNPGNDTSLFNQVGLKNNDLAIAINGYDLRNEEEAQKIMQDLATLTSINITVIRDGELQEIQIMLDEE